MLWDSSLPFHTSSSKARAKRSIWPISFPEGWLCVLIRLNLYSWSCVHGWVVSVYEDDTLVYHLVSPNLLSETSIYISSGNHRIEKKWMVHTEISPLPFVSPSASYNQTVGSKHISKWISVLWTAGLCSSRTRSFSSLLVTTDYNLHC